MSVIFKKGRFVRRADETLRKAYKKSPLMIRRVLDPILNRGRFCINYYVIMPEFPKNINLSVSSACQGRCIFCPPNRGKYIKPKHMPFRLADGIFDELSKKNFKGEINLGENGEATLNPAFIKILECLNKKLPSVRSRLVSNMNRVDESLSRRILKNGLSELHFNIDGATELTYEFVKGLSFETMQKNVHNFLRIREELKSTCKVNINIVTAAKYMREVLGVNPRMPYDAPQIVSYWEPFLRKGDTIQELRPFWWARREEMRVPNNIGCAQLSRVVNELFVAPSGDCYVCCLDYNSEISFGNLNDSSISEIWKGRRRFEILRHLFLKQFKSLGEPCSICLY